MTLGAAKKAAAIWLSSVVIGVAVHRNDGQHDALIRNSSAQAALHRGRGPEGGSELLGWDIVTCEVDELISWHCADLPVESQLNQHGLVSDEIVARRIAADIADPMLEESWVPVQIHQYPITS